MNPHNGVLKSIMRSKKFGQILEFQNSCKKMEDLQVKNQWSEIGPAKKRTKNLNGRKVFLKIMEFQRRGVARLKLKLCFLNCICNCMDQIFKAS